WKIRYAEVQRIASGGAPVEPTAIEPTPTVEAGTDRPEAVQATAQLRTRVSQKDLEEGLRAEAQREAEGKAPARVGESAKALRDQETKDAEEGAKRKDAEKEALTEKPSLMAMAKKKRAEKEGKAAGDAMAKSFKKGIKDTKIPIKPDEEKEREKDR